MDDTLREMAEAAGLERSGELPAGKGDAIPEPAATQTVAGDWLYHWQDQATLESIRITVASPAVQGKDLWAFLTVQYLSEPTSIPSSIESMPLSGRGNQRPRPVTLLSKKRWNLRSTSHTESHVRALKRRIDRDWDGRLTQVAAHLEANYHFGDPGVWLDEVAPPGPVTYLVDKLVEQGQHTVIAADGGSLKSMLASALAVSLGLGHTLLPGLDVLDRSRTLYLDYETDQSVHKRRYDRLLEGAGIITSPSSGEGKGEGEIPSTPTDHRSCLRPIPPLSNSVPRGDRGQATPSQIVMYKRLYAPLVDASDEIRKLIARYAFQFVVIDSASRAVGGETVDESMVVPYFNAAASWGVTVLTIAHKAKDPSSKGPAGAAQWFNQARSYWEVEKDQIEGDDVVRIALRHEKSNNGRLHRPIGFRVEFSDEAVRFNYSDAAESMAIRSKLPPLERVIADLKETPNSTTREISERTGLAINHTGNVLRMSEGRHFRGTADRYNRRWSLLKA